MVREKLIVKGQVQSQFLAHKLPLSADSPPEIEMSESDAVTDSGSHFIGFAARAKSTQDVRTVRDQLLKRTDVASTSDIMYAYRIAKKRSCVENFDSEFDHGVGLELLRWMRSKSLTDYVCFAIRTCSPGYKHIGKKRFEIINSLCAEAVDAL